MSIHPGLHHLYDASKDIPLLVLKTDSCIHCLVTSKSHSITRTVSIQKGDQSSNQYRYKTLMSRNFKECQGFTGTGSNRYSWGGGGEPENEEGRGSGASAWVWARCSWRLNWYELFFIWLYSKDLMNLMFCILQYFQLDTVI